ncbi:unnamed protein product, partial [Auanema sp. JU1783]
MTSIITTVTTTALPDESSKDDKIIEGIRCNEDLDDLAWKHFNQTTVKTDSGRLSVSLPFLEPPSLLSSNYPLALARLRNLYRKIRDTQLWPEYVRCLHEQQITGVLETVPESALDDDSYYIPHSAVLKPSSHTTKVRIVLDASSHQAGKPSLNDLLIPGQTIHSISTYKTKRCRFNIGRRSGCNTKKFKT